MLVNQLFRRDDHPRRTVAALNGPVFHKTYLKRVRVFSVADAFHSCNLISVSLERQCEAGVHCLSVEQNRAGTAVTFGTAVFDLNGPKPISKGIQKRLTGTYFSLPTYSV
jgi:hypothetical protein